MVPADTLRGLYRTFILNFGGTDEEANTFANLVLLADLRGMDWQGIRSLDRHYIFDIQHGNIRLGQPLTVLDQGIAHTVLDANRELGQVACKRAMELTIEKALTAGVAATSIRHCGDTGLLAAYTLMCIDHDCIGIAFNNTNPYVAPWGGAQAMHGIDPLSVAVPAGASYPILLDMSITKAQPFFNNDRTMTRPFTRPQVMFFDSVREYGLSVVVELICGALALMPLGRDRTSRGESAVFMLALHIPHFVDLSEFGRLVDRYIRLTKDSGSSNDAGEILLPGERGFRENEKRLDQGIPIPLAVWSATEALASAVGLDWKPFTTTVEARDHG
jgi:LDH2 family malate/lactate/ureidoglycolate dehydrogenase